MKQFILATSLSFCMLLANKSFGQTDFSTIIANVSSALKKGVSVSSTNSTATAYMASQNADGSWPDIAYASGAAGDVPFNTHLTRLYQFALAYTLSGGTHYADANLYNSISLALEYWNGHIHDANNWYYDQIGYPQYLGQTMVLLRGGSQPISAIDSTNVMNYLAGRENPSVETGANRIDVALHWLYRGVLTASASVVNTAVTQGGSTLNLVNSGSEGINYDYAFLQHGAELMTQTYGSVLLSDVYSMANYLVGTSYGFTASQMQNAFVLMHNSFYGASRGRWKDFSLDGRAISRSNDLGLSPTYAALAMKVDPTNIAALRNDSMRLSGVQPASYNVAAPYHIHYWTGDYTLHNRPNYAFSVRSVSSRTLRDESINGENLKGTFLSEGATNIRVAGNEYYNIFPVWDWNMIPGITMRQFATTPTNSSNVAGNQAFVGGVSDSTYGASANYMNYNNVTAKKAWFFFDDEVVCVGAGITSTSSENVATCVNQCLLTGSVFVNNGGTISTLATQTQTPFMGNLQWALQGGVGYFFPSGGNITVSNQAQTGSWNSINTGGSTSTVTTDVFKMWVDHGTTPNNATYTYIVLPNIITTDQMTAYNQNNIKVLINTVSYQAVKHEGLNMLQAIVRATGGGTITDPTSGMKLTVDQPCAVLVKNVGSNTVSISIADPAQISGTINVGITFPGTTPAITKAIIMPTGNYKGSSIAFTTNINDVSSTSGTFTAVANGNWATPAIWMGGVVPLTGSIVTIPSGITVTVSAALTRDAGSTLTVNGTLLVNAILTANGAVSVNGGTVQVNQAGIASTTANSIHFKYDDDATLIFNNTSAANVTDGNIFWGRTYGVNEFTTTAPRNVTIAGTGNFGIYGAGVRTISNLFKITSPITITTSYSTAGAKGSFTINTMFEVAASVTIGANLTCYGVCQIDVGGSMTSGGTIGVTGYPSTPITALNYGSTSSLIYNTGTNAVGMEWATAINGAPTNIEVMSGVLTGAASGRACTGNFTIDAGSTFKLNGGNGYLNIGGNWTNNGTFTPNTSAVNLNGTAIQSITGTTAFYNLALNNSNNFTVNNDLIINNSLNLTSGKLLIGDNNVSVANGITGGSSTNYVVINGIGKLKIGSIGSTSGTVLFPIGYSSSSYTPLSLSNTGMTDNFSVNVQSPISSVSLNDGSKVVPILWDVTEDVAGSSSATITFQWNASDAASATNFSIGGNNSIGHYANGAWQKQSVTINGSGPYTATNTVAYTNFSPFAVGMSDGFDGTGVLPLTLISFSATATNNQVSLKWSVADELNVSKYAIEKSIDGKKFISIINVAALNHPTANYYFNDMLDNGSLSYYRLKMLDKDGSYAYSKTIAVTTKPVTALSLFPNPAHDDLFVTYARTDGAASISVFSSTGKLVGTYPVAAQSTQATIDISTFAAGSYVLKLQNSSQSETVYFIKL